MSYVNVLVPRPGYGIEDLKKKATHENAEIHRFRNGILKEIGCTMSSFLGRSWSQISSTPGGGPFQ